MFDKGPQSSVKQVIAVTGPMAAGKNFICSQMQKEGWAAVDADLLVHDAIEIVKERILDTFIPYAEQQNIKLTRTDGSIDRRFHAQRNLLAEYQKSGIPIEIVNNS